MQPDEVEFLLSNEKVSPLSKTSRSIINRIIEFRKTKITQVMIPKSDILAVNVEQPREKLMQEIIDTQFSRIPVYRDSVDNIIGIVTAKDIAMAWRNGDILTIEDLIRPVYYVPETAYIKQILLEFKKGKDHMAIIVDEFGSTIGLVTMEDLLEEIVGEVWDEYDEKDGRVCFKI
jgi:CBS domain containing-hemolysin-like protein